MKRLVAKPGMPALPRCESHEKQAPMSMQETPDIGMKKRTNRTPTRGAIRIPNLAYAPGFRA